MQQPNEQVSTAEGSTETTLASDSSTEATPQPTLGQEEAAPKLPPNPKLEAAKFLTGAIPAFKGMVDRLTGVQSKRVLTALTEAPLADEQPVFSTKEALHVYELGLNITNAKFILFQEALKDRDQAEIMELADKTLEENKEGVANG